MNIVRWNPVREFFDDAFFPVQRSLETSEAGAWKPVVDIYENDDKVTITAEIPGVDKKDISIDFKDHVMTIKGERSQENEVEEKNYYRRERPFGSFQRSFSLPADYGADNISADFKDGVLNISILKPEKKKPKQITVH